MAFGTFPLGSAMQCISRSMLTGFPAATAAAVAAGSWAAGAYLDAKFHLRKDLTALRRLKVAEREYARAGTSPWTSPVFCALLTGGQQ